MDKEDKTISILFNMVLPIIISLKLIQEEHLFLALFLTVSTIWLLYRKLLNYTNIINNSFIMINIVLTVFILKLIV